MIDDLFDLDLRSRDQRERADLGIWDGTGYQRVDQAQPGAVVHHDSEHVTVRVRVHITPSRRRGPRSKAVPPSPALPPRAVRSTVPPPVASGWQPQDAYMLQIAVPLVLQPDGALVIDQPRFTGQPEESQ